MKEPNLAGRTALVTGAGRGIGRATALALARCGATVYAVARSEAEIQDVAGTIRQEGGQAQAIPCDISRADEVEALFRSAGPIDILINNAARIQPIAPVVSIDPEEWRRNMATNLDGVFFACHFALPHMLERGWGRIINLSAGAARGSQSHWGAYASSKAGVETLTKILAQEVGERGIRANVVRPGIVDTDMQSEIRSSTEEQFGRENLDRFRGYHSRGLLRPPEHPAQLILWLLSPEADDLNGEVLYIDDPDVAARIGLEARGR